MKHNEMPKDTVDETLLQRCQREAQRIAFKAPDLQPAIFLTDVETLITNTLKQAAEALEGMKIKPRRLDTTDSLLGQKQSVWNGALTDAQKLIRGELDI